jgi:serine phosphatase RsbU (regulator of sigma subunit)
MEIWGGIEPVEKSLATPGLDLWVYSQPFRGEEEGGDVYYVSLCGGGLITRIAVADVSGHGRSVAGFSSSLRAIIRRNINQKSQDRLVRELDRQFAAMAAMRHFATAIVATCLASTDRLSISVAGHPSPLLRRARDGQWSLIAQGGGAAGPLANLPLGLDEGSGYANLTLDFAPGDVVVFYTDALIEAADEHGRLLGPEGLLDAARQADLAEATPRRLGVAILEAVENHRQGQPAADDLTLVVARHNAGSPRKLSLAQKIDVYAKVFGLRPV